MDIERAEQIHDRAWADYMKAFWRVRAKRGRGAFAAQQAMISTSDRVMKAQQGLTDVEERVRREFCR